MAIYKVTHFRKSLLIDSSKPYGVIKVFFGNPNSFAIKKISLTKFIALSHILENDEVGYDTQNKMFVTPVEPSNYGQAPNGEIT